MVNFLPMKTKIPPFRLIPKFISGGPGRRFWLAALAPFLLTGLFAAGEQVHKYSGKELATLITLDSSLGPDGKIINPWFLLKKDHDPREEYLNILKDQPTPGWLEVPLPGAMDPGKYGHFEPGATFLIRRDFYLETVANRAYAIHLGMVSDRDKTYLNGQLIGSTGEFDAALPQGYDRRRVYEIPPGLLKEGRNILISRVQGYFYDSVGLIASTAYLGPAKHVWKEFHHTEYVKIFFLMVYLTAGAYFLFLFIRRPMERENLYFGLFSILLVVYQFFRNQLKYDLVFDFFTMKRAEYIILMSLVPLMFHFFRSYFDLRRRQVYLEPFTALADWLLPAAKKETWGPWLEKTRSGIVYGLDGILGLFALWYLFSTDVRTWDTLNSNFIQPFIWIWYFIGILYIIVGQLIRKNRDSVYFFGGMLVMLVLMVLDILSNNHIINLPRMMGYGFIFFILNLAGVLANKFVRLNFEIEDLNANLEKKVEERTAELRAAFQDIQSLKLQQDGDYFLTSLLIKPLSVNKVTSDTVSIDFLTRQKKKFKFRKWETQLGGDINIAHSIELMGRHYTVFVNADAMGKSMQGAGGALVLGVVFNAVVARTRASRNARERFPEKWLKDCFQELQSVFVSFDGSMLISVVLGLVDDDTGLLYYINAEHPWSILYRDHRATFLEEELTTRKIGIVGIEKEFLVRTAQLRDGDVVILGSDGRDDLLLKNPDGEPAGMNEDETSILRRVEEGGGQLETILTALQRKGDLTDDLTFLRIGYREEHKPGATSPPEPEKPAEFLELFAKAREALEKDPKDLKAAVELLGRAVELDFDQQAVLMLTRGLVRLRRYEEAARLSERAVTEYPGQLEFIYLASYIHKLTRNYQKAVDHGERYQLRKRQDIKNILNLADTYRLMRHWDRAEVFLELARDLEPENANVGKLQRALAESRGSKAGGTTEDS